MADIKNTISSMKADNQHMDIDELLVKYLAGEAGAEEREQVEKWIAANAENRKHYGQFKLLWDESQQLVRNSSIDEDKAWNRFRERIQKEYVTGTKSNANFQWLKVAAVILLVSAAALMGPYFFVRHNDTRYTTEAVNTPPATILKSVTAENTKVDTLPDGSVITLNKYSSLKYPADFNGKTRNVELSGEAFFNIHHDQSKPFIIKANDLLITVLGTSFNVKTSGDETEVIVKTGVVGVKKQMKSISLYPGEKVTVFKTDTSLKKEPNRDTVYMQYLYKQHVYAFKKPASANADTFDINKNPDLLKEILKDPKKRAALLKNYTPESENITVRRAVIRNVMDEMVKEKIMVKGNIRSFRLNENEFIINDKRQADVVQQHFRELFIKEPGYTIYFGGAPRNGRGVFLSQDSL
jgi:transmembrane sensor